MGVSLLLLCVGLVLALSADAAGLAVGVLRLHGGIARLLGVAGISPVLLGVAGIGLVLLGVAGIGPILLGVAGVGPVLLGVAGVGPVLLGVAGVSPVLLGVAGVGPVLLGVAGVGCILLGMARIGRILLGMARVGGWLLRRVLCAVARSARAGNVTVAVVAVQMIVHGGLSLSIPSEKAREGAIRRVTYLCLFYIYSVT